VADVGGEHLADRRPVGRGVTGDAFQRVHAPQAQVEPVRAELVDRAGEPLGELALLGDVELLAGGLDLPPGEVGAKHQHPAGQALQQRRPGVVLEPEPVVAELHAVLAGNLVPVELPVGERRVQQARHDDHDGEQHGRHAEGGEHPARRGPAAPRRAGRVHGW